MRRPTHLGSWDSTESSPRAGPQEALPGPDNHAWFFVFLLDNRGSAPVVMGALGAVEVTTSSSFQCLGASPHRGVVSGLASQVAC